MLKMSFIALKNEMIILIYFLRTIDKTNIKCYNQVNKFIKNKFKLICRIYLDLLVNGGNMGFWNVMAYIGIGIGGAAVFSVIAIIAGMFDIRSKLMSMFFFFGMSSWFMQWKYDFSIMKSIGIGITTTILCNIVLSFISKIILQKVWIAVYSKEKLIEEMEDCLVIARLLCSILLCIIAGILLSINLSSLNVI